MNVAISLGGVAIGAAVLWANIRPWWKGGRDPKALVPYGSGGLLGALSTICVGGALGWGAAGVAGLASSWGTRGVSTATGAKGSAGLPTGSMGTLTQEGAVVTVLLAVGVGLLYKASGKQDKRRIIGGFVTLAILGFLPGVAAALGWLPDSVNGMGAWAKARLSQGGGA
ncbi:hypothetical protein ACWDHW_13210 [Streptomyces melanosporofaciens]|uniref:hypothetical protein n=1 Tax=Streptomyces sp. NPDC021218 TaxID=3365119 RepID=UPI0037B78A11